MSRKKELENMNLSELLSVAHKYDISTDKKKSELIEAILLIENPPKKKRGARNAARTKLKAVRVASGIGQRELSEATGINLGTLQHYEQGAKPLDSARMDVILKICSVLNCKIIDVIDNDELNNMFSEQIKKEIQ